MCGAPAEPGMARPGRGSAPSPQKASCLLSAAHRWRHHMAESPTSVGPWPAPAWPGGDARERLGALPPLLSTRWAASYGRSRGAAAACVELLPDTAKGFAVQLRTPAIALHAHAMGRHSPGSQRSSSQLRPCLFFPLHPQGDSTRFGLLALRSCICFAACQNRLARTAVANPGRSVRRRRTAGFPAAGRIPPIRRIVFVRTALALGRPGPVACRHGPAAVVRAGPFYPERTDTFFP